MGHLLSSQMRKKVVDVKNGFVRIFAHADFNAATVGKHYNAVKRKRYRSPLIFFYAAVVMRLKKAKTAVLVKRILF